MFGRFSGANFAGANLRGASLAPFSATGFIEVLWHSRACQREPERRRSLECPTSPTFRSASPTCAAPISRGAILKNADLSHADLTGADLSNADVSNADLDGAILTGAKGLATVAGLDEARKRGKVID